MIALVIMCGESMLFASELSVIVIVPHSSHIKMVPQFPYSIVISFPLTFYRSVLPDGNESK